MNKSTLMAATAAIGLTIGAPAYALCPGGVDTPPFCETGNFVPFSAPDEGNCFKVLNTDTGDKFAMASAVPVVPLTVPTIAQVDMLVKGGPLTVFSDGFKTACGPYTITNVRNALY